MVSINVLLECVLIFTSYTTKLTWARWPVKVSILYMVPDLIGYSVFIITGLTCPDPHLFLHEL